MVDPQRQKPSASLVHSALLDLLTYNLQLRSTESRGFLRRHRPSPLSPVPKIPPSHDSTVVLPPPPYPQRSPPRCRKPAHLPLPYLQPHRFAILPSDIVSSIKVQFSMAVNTSPRFPPFSLLSSPVLSTSPATTSKPMPPLILSQLKFLLPQPIS